MNKKYLISLVLLIMVFFSSFGHAASASVQLVAIIPDYMPDQIRFQVNSDIGSCASGVWLDRFGVGSNQDTKRQNNTVAYSSLLAALMSGKTVIVYVDESNCHVENLQFVNY